MSRSRQSKAVPTGRGASGPKAPRRTASEPRDAPTNPDFVFKRRDAQGKEETFVVEVKRHSGRADPDVYLVGPDGKVVWLRGLDHKPSFLRGLSAKSAAYGLLETEREQFRSLSRTNPKELERRLESIHGSDPSVGWFFSDYLAQEGIIAVGEARRA